MEISSRAAFMRCINIFISMSDPEADVEDDRGGADSGCMLPRLSSPWTVESHIIPLYVLALRRHH